MKIKTILDYSHNFNSKKRKINQIKFIIFHYTGMKKESEAINKLINTQSQVSCHYFIKNNGKIITMVPNSYIAWHAGISSWKNFKLLNKNSIGVEISNPGHNFKYRNFSKQQIQSILKLSKFLIKKFKIEKKNILGHSDIAPDRKKDPGEKFPWEYLSKKQVGLWHTLSNSLLKKKRMQEINQISKKYFYNNLLKIGYSLKNPNNIKKDRFLTFVVKAFQRRFRQDLINGIIDQECLMISSNLAKKLK